MWRDNLEDKYTVICHGCNAEFIDPNKTSSQKYAKVCKNCGRTNKDNYKLQRKMNAGVVHIGVFSNMVKNFC